MLRFRFGAGELYIPQINLLQAGARRDLLVREAGVKLVLTKRGEGQGCFLGMLRFRFSTAELFIRALRSGAAAYPDQEQEDRAERSEAGADPGEAAWETGHGEMTGRGDPRGDKGGYPISVG